MKKSALAMMLAVALGLLVVPGVSGTSLVATATGNNTSVGSHTSSGNNTVVASASEEEEEEEATNDVVTAANGEAVVSSIPTSNTSNVQVAMVTPAGTLKSLAGIQNGIELRVENSQCGPLARQAVTDAAISAGGNLVSILELDLLILNDSGNFVGDRVTTLSAPVEFTISVPEGVDPAANDFAMVRLHDGVTTILPDTDDDPNTITFSTDRFSVYAIISGPKGAFDSYKAGVKTAVKDSVPKTGDSIPAALPLAAAACLSAAAIVSRKKTV